MVERLSTFSTQYSSMKTAMSSKLWYVIDILPFHMLLTMTNPNPWRVSDFWKKYLARKKEKRFDKLDRYKRKVCYFLHRGSMNRKKKR